MILLPAPAFFFKSYFSSFVSASPHGNFGFVTYSGVKVLSHHVQFLNLITDKRPRLRMRGFRLFFVHQIHIVQL